MILDQMPTFDRFDFMSSIKLKMECNDKGMYAFISWKWINPLVEWIGNRKCLEIMAGAGYLSYALREKNISVIATDDMSWHEKMKWELVTKVEKLTANQAIFKYGKQVDIVIMGWPYMDDFAFKALRYLHRINPNALMMYIGESIEGCTADYNFFQHFDVINDHKFNKVKINYEQFLGIHDQPYLGRYKSKKKKQSYGYNN
jgi:hypothetical protein